MIKPAQIKYTVQWQGMSLLHLIVDIIQKTNSETLYMYKQLLC